MNEVVSINIDENVEPKQFLDSSKRWTIDLPSIRIGKGIYKPGWRWSKHAGALTGKPSQAHVGYIESGHMIVKGVDGVEVTIGPGDFFELKPNHDAWVVGDEACVALDFSPKIT